MTHRGFHSQIVLAQQNPNLGAFWEDDREGLPPVPLPGKEPIPEFVVDLLAALLGVLQPGEGMLYGILLLQAVQLQVTVLSARVDCHTLPCKTSDLAYTT